MRKLNLKKSAATAAALVLCAGILTACGGAASSTASVAASSEAASQSVVAEAASSEAASSEAASSEAPAASAEALADGVYSCTVTLGGGSGKTTVSSPVELTVAEGKMTAVITWSSSKYDYMLVDGEKFLPLSNEGGSTYEIPVAALDTELAVVADTIAMGNPHEIEYTLTFSLE